MGAAGLMGDGGSTPPARLMALPADERPLDHTPIHTSTCRPRPCATATSRRRRGSRRPPSCCTSATTSAARWPPTSGGSAAGCCGVPARPPGPMPATWPCDSDDLSRQHSFRLFADGSGDGDRAGRRDGRPLPHLEGSPPRRRLTCRARREVADDLAEQRAPAPSDSDFWVSRPAAPRRLRGCSPTKCLPMRAER